MRKTMKRVLIACLAVMVTAGSTLAQTAVLPSPGAKIAAGALAIGAAKTCLKHKITCAVVGATAAIVGGKVINKVRAKTAPDEFCSEGYDRLFRVVSRTEAADIEATGRYNIAVNSYEGKQFWTRIDNAVWYHVKTLSFEDAKAGRVLVTSLACKSTIEAGYAFDDGEVGRTAVTFDIALLEKVNFDASKTLGIKVIRVLPWSKQ